MAVSSQKSRIMELSKNFNNTLSHSDQGWVFAMAKSIFARTVEKTGKNRK